MRNAVAWVAAGCALACGCGPTRLERVVGSNGGSVELGSAAVVIPPGALASETTIGIAEVDAADLPALPDDVELAGPAIALTPHGLAFAAPVTIRLPYDGSGDLTIAGLDDANDSDWELLDVASFDGGIASFEATHFSIRAVARRRRRDAGMDAGSGDAGIDAGASDAGSDAGWIDECGIDHGGCAAECACDDTRDAPPACTCPTGDTCADAIDLALAGSDDGTTITYAGDTLGLADDVSAWCAERWGEGPDLVLRWTADVDGPIVLRATSADDVRLIVRESDCAAGTLVACGDDVSGTDAQAIVHVAMGTTYFVWVDDGATGAPFTLTLTRAAIVGAGETCTSDRVCPAGEACGSPSGLPCVGVVTITDFTLAPGDAVARCSGFGSAVEVSWTALVEEDPNFDLYLLQRRTPTGTAYEDLVGDGRAGPGVVHHVADCAPIGSGTYAYRVRAVYTENSVLDLAAGTYTH